MNRKRKIFVAAVMMTLFALMFIVSCKKVEFSEEEKIKIYLDSHDIDAEPTESGMYYIEYIKGSGDLAVDLDTVEVTYIGRFLSDEVFDANTIEFTVGDEQIIKGWNEGVKYMKEGGKALLIIPSWLAYGEFAYRGIPGNTSLVFEMNLNHITPGPNHTIK